MGLLRTGDWQGAKWIGLDRGENEQSIEIADLAAAKWLWFPEGNAAVDAPTETRFFRRSFSLPMVRKVRRAVCLFAADDHCTLAVNGVEIGMSRGHPNLVGVDVTSHLRSGVNLLTAVVANLSAPVSQNPGGWIAAVRIDFENGPPLVDLFRSKLKCQKRPAMVGSRPRSTTPLGCPRWNWAAWEWLPGASLGKGRISRKRSSPPGGALFAPAVSA